MIRACSLFFFLNIFSLHSLEMSIPFAESLLQQNVTLLGSLSDRDPMIPRAFREDSRQSISDDYKILYQVP